MLPIKTVIAFLVIQRLFHNGIRTVHSSLSPFHISGECFRVNRQEGFISLQVFLRLVGHCHGFFVSCQVERSIQFCQKLAPFHALTFISVDAIHRTDDLKG